MAKKPLLVPFYRRTAAPVWRLTPEYEDNSDTTPKGRVPNQEIEWVENKEFTLNLSFSRRAEDGWFGGYVFTDEDPSTGETRQYFMHQLDFDEFLVKCSTDQGVILNPTTFTYKKSGRSYSLVPVYG